MNNPYVAEVVDYAQRFVNSVSKKENFIIKLDYLSERNGTVAQIGASALKKVTAVFWNAITDVRGAYFEDRLFRYGGAELVEHAYEVSGLDHEPISKTRWDLANFVISEWGKSVEGNNG